MIGDWVKVRATFDIYRTVTSVGDSGICILDDAVEYDCDEIEPIRITREILENNGFVAGITDYYHNNKYDCDIISSNCLILYANKDNHGESKIKGIQDVHELQRALRSCGLWNLANNFKI